MLKLIGLVVLVGVGFGLGYYFGQRPVTDLKNAVTDLTRNVLDTTVGVERNLRVRQGLVDAKSRLIQAKSEMLDRNYGNAAKALSETVASLEQAASAGPEGQRNKMGLLIKQVREIEGELSQGKRIPRSRLDQIQTELDTLLLG
jgi:hypothetical protein